MALSRVDALRRLVKRRRLVLEYTESSSSQVAQASPQNLARVQEVGRIVRGHCIIPLLVAGSLRAGAAVHFRVLCLWRPCASMKP